MSFWIEFFKDKRFSLDFKIANFIMRDSLRNYLSCALLELEKDTSYIDDKNANKIQRKRMDKIAKDIKILFSTK